MLHEFWENFTHNLFKPLLLFFYFGFLIPILKVRFEFPYVIYQGLTMYLLLYAGLIVAYVSVVFYLAREAANPGEKQEKGAAIKGATPDQPTAEGA